MLNYSGAQSQQRAGAVESSDQSLQVAVAVALLRNKLVRKEPPASESDAQRWKKKAKERKQELMRLREELKATEEGMQDDLFPRNVACKCYFFSDVGTSSPKQFGEGLNGKVNDVLRRRFLRQVRLKERRKKQTGGSVQQLYFADFSKEDGMEQFKSSVDFLADLCENVNPAEEVKFGNWSHQAIEFILDSLKNMRLEEKNSEAVEGTVCSLVMRLVRRMTASRPIEGGDSQIYIQHVVRKLGSDPFFGQRALLSVSQRICALAENLLFVDPFDAAFPNMHNSMFVMIQLIEFLILDYLLTWPGNQGFETTLFQEWTTSIVHSRKALEVLEARNGLYILYLDRALGHLAKAVIQVPSLQKLNQDVFDNLFS